MKVWIVAWSPEPRDFGAALFESARMSLVLAGHQVRVSDLREDRFDPIGEPRTGTAGQDAEAADVAEERRKLAWCDVLILQFPFRRTGLPAVPQGWIDRVFGETPTGGPGRTFGNGPCRGKRAVLSLTIDGAPADYRPGGTYGDLGDLLRPIRRGLLGLLGFDGLSPQVTYSSETSAPEARTAALAGWRKRVRDLDAETPLDPADAW